MDSFLSQASIPGLIYLSRREHFITRSFWVIFLGESKWQTKKIRAPTSACAQQCLVLVSGIALGVVIFDSAVADWDARPVATDTEVMSRPVAELLFPTVTVCADGDTPPDPMAPIHA